MSIPGTATIQYGYTRGLMSSTDRQDSKLSSNPIQRYEIANDPWGNVLQVSVKKKPDSSQEWSAGTVLASYDYMGENGFLERMTYGNGDYIVYTYDYLGRIATAAHYSSGGKLDYTEVLVYDGTGNTGRCKVVDSQGEIIEDYRYEYDTLGRLIATNQIANHDQIQSQRIYDDVGRLSQQTWVMDNGKKRHTEIYEYDNNNGSLKQMRAMNGDYLINAYGSDIKELTSITAKGNEKKTTRYEKKFTYRHVGQGSSADRISAQIEKVNYTGLKTASGANAAVSFNYTYDQAGNIEKVKNVDGTYTVYSYDIQGQLCKATDYLKDGTVSRSYTYQYDNVGNLISRSDGKTTHRYEYTDANWLDLLTAFDGQKITYKAGNPISYYNGTRWTFGWKNGRQLSSASSAEHDISYTYDGSGLRTSKTVDGVRHNYIYGEGRILKEYTSDYALYFFYNADGTPYGCYYKPTNGGGANYYYVTNLQGDVTHLIDSSSKIVASYEYDPYGKVLKASGTMAQINPLRYRGYYYDTDSELYYLQSRYYDPVTCRFINADRYSSTGQGILGYNMFAYCGNNPVNGVDYTGEAWWHWMLGAAVVAVCAVATVVTCGGFAAAAGAVASVSGGIAAATTASTIAAGAFIGSATTYAASVAIAESSSNSLEEFCSQGNWGTVAASAGGALLGGTESYWNTKGSITTSSTEKPKVTSTIKNDIIDLPRTGSALKADPYHAFPNVVDNYAGYAVKSPINNAELYQLQGSLNGISGRFEWIIQNQQITHRMFVPGGGINGIPIVP